MSITGDHPADASAIIVRALEPVTFPVHRPGVPADVIAPPCVLVGLAFATDQLLGLACPEWAWSTLLLCIAADTTGAQLNDVVHETMHALWQAGVRSTSQPRTWNPDNRAPAGIPAIEITCT